MKKYGYNPIHPMTRFDLWIINFERIQNKIMSAVFWAFVVNAVWMFCTAAEILIKTLLN